MKKCKQWLINTTPMLVGAAISLSVGLLSALLTKDNMNIYEKINRPPLAPPGWLFPIVWTILYILMGVGAGIVYKNKEDCKEGSRKALKQFAFQLIPNFLWSIVFFNLNSFVLALAVLLVLLIGVIYMSISFYRVKPIAGYLQIPYIVWLLIALYLNVAIVILN